MLIIHNFYSFFCGKPKAINLPRLGMVNTTTAPIKTVMTSGWFINFITGFATLDIPTRLVL